MTHVELYVIRRNADERPTESLRGFPCIVEGQWSGSRYGHLNSGVTATGTRCTERRLRPRVLF